MNRIIQFLHQSECRCQAAKRQYRELKDKCEEIEALAGGAIEFLIPGVRRLAGDLDELDPEEKATDAPTLQIFIAIEPERAPLDVDLIRFAADEMNRIANELLSAADRLEGTVQA